jgi:hypothetical protein
MGRLLRWFYVYNNPFSRIFFFVLNPKPITSTRAAIQANTPNTLFSAIDMPTPMMQAAAATAKNNKGHLMFFKRIHLPKV